uniref:Uncharacterized protein n=1 Tax=Ciona intestinalis TaxID=7719 RepID=H2XPL8_CIOIN
MYSKIVIDLGRVKDFFSNEKTFFLLNLIEDPGIL